MAKTKIAEIGQTYVQTEFVFDFTRKYFGFSLFYTQKIAKFYGTKFGQTCFETS